MSTSYDAFRVKSHDGKVVRGKVCKAIVGEGKGHENVVMLHGWLDNSASFENFLSRAERFDSDSSSNASNSTRRTATFYAIDLPGHGRSDHLGGHTCVLAEYVAYVKDVVASVLRDDDDDDDDRGGERDDGSRTTTTTTTTTKGKVTIIGHSMGSSIAAMYASAYPEDVERLVMIEGIGPHARGEGDSPGEGIRRHVERRRRGGEGRVYDSLNDAIEARVRAGDRMPGGGSISRAAARSIVMRGASYVTDSGDVTRRCDDCDGKEEGEGGGGGKVAYDHDRRLRCPSILYMTESQVKSMLGSISCSTLVVRGAQGYESGLGLGKDFVKGRVEAFKDLKVVTCEGGHHLHADPETSEKVKDEIYKFLGYA